MHGLVVQNDRRGEPSEHDAGAAACQYSTDHQRLLGDEEGHVGGADGDGGLHQHVHVAERSLGRAHPAYGDQADDNTHDDGAEAGFQEEQNDGTAGVCLAVEEVIEHREEHHGGTIVEQRLADNDHRELGRGSGGLQKGHHCDWVRGGGDRSKGHTEVPTPLGQHRFDEAPHDHGTDKYSRACQDQSLRQGAFGLVPVQAHGLSEDQRGKENEKQEFGVNVDPHLD